jgi:hypothetical protein
LCICTCFTFTYSWRLELRTHIICMLIYKSYTDKNSPQKMFPYEKTTFFLNDLIYTGCSKKYRQHAMWTLCGRKNFPCELSTRKSHFYFLRSFCLVIRLAFLGDRQRKLYCPELFVKDKRFLGNQHNIPALVDTRRLLL